MKTIALVAKDYDSFDDLEIALAGDHELFYRDTSISPSPWVSLLGLPKFGNRKEAIDYLQESYAPAGWRFRLV